MERLRFIKRAQSLGFTLEEIGRLLALRISHTATAKDVRDEAEEKIAQIEAKIAALTDMRTALTHLVEQCHGEGPTSDCPILDALTDTEITS